jgi:hypothetical protein
MTGDRRTLLARPDLADDRLQGLVRAQSFAETQGMICIRPTAGILKSPEAAAVQEDELLFGEAFEVLEVRDGWAWGQAARDGYVGFVRTEALAVAGEAPTHRVAALSSAGFSRPNLKSQVLQILSMNSLVRAGEAKDGFIDCGAAGWIYAAHLQPIGVFESDWIAVAERFLGAPYLWGARSNRGLDCSGLVQAAMQAAGQACPRDTDQQFAAFAEGPDRSRLQRGDLAFWLGHTGIMLDGERLLHANAHHMAVAIEPLDEALVRIEKAAVPFAGYRRP